MDRETAIETGSLLRVTNRENDNQYAFGMTPGIRGYLKKSNYLVVMIKRGLPHEILVKLVNPAKKGSRSNERLHVWWFHARDLEFLDDQD